MSDKIQPEITGGRVKKAQLKKLVDNYYRVMKKTDENGKVVDLDRTKDAQSVWFPKAVLDEMFAAHGCNAQNNDEYGIRIYFGVHQTGILNHDEIPGHYDNQQTVVLVPTKNQNGFRDQDLIRDKDALVGADGKGDGIQPIGVDPDGDGYNHGKICPPDTDCGCAI